MSKNYKIISFLHNKKDNYKRFWGHLVYGDGNHFFFYGQDGKTNSITFTFKCGIEGTRNVRYNKSFIEKESTRVINKFKKNGYEDITIDDYETMFADFKTDLEAAFFAFLLMSNFDFE